LTVDNTEVRRQQLARLADIKSKRDDAAVKAALEAITKGAASSEANLLSLCVTAARERATLGEISQAMEDFAGRHHAQVRTIVGVYGVEYSQEGPAIKAVEKIRSLIKTFNEREGRRPRILVAKMGQDGHDRGAKVVATAFADLGFDVDVGPLFQTPEETARQAVENDVHIVGMSSLAAGHKTLLPQLVAALKAMGRDDIMVICGGVVPPQDHEFLRANGASAIFGPGTVIPEAAATLLHELNRRLGYDEDV